MGRVITPRYAVHYVSAPARMTSSAWRGRVSEARLREHVESLNRSFEPDGCNAHCGPLRISAAEIRVNERDGAVVASYQAPAFEVR